MDRFTPFYQPSQGISYPWERTPGNISQEQLTEYTHEDKIDHRSYEHNLSSCKIKA